MNPRPKLPFSPEKAPNTGRRLPSNKGSDRKKYVFRGDPEDTAIFKRFIINVFQRLGYRFKPPEATVLIDYQQHLSNAPHCLRAGTGNKRPGRRALARSPPHTAAL